MSLEITLAVNGASVIDSGISALRFVELTSCVLTFGEDQAAFMYPLIFATTSATSLSS